MPLEVKKLPRESSQSLIRRFSRKMKQSGILLEARKKLFYLREKGEQMKKRAALRREMIKKEYKKLMKLGQLRRTKKIKFK
ncbi:MAG TPA: hypothetical protein ENL27_00235 [Candidatus Parcubacteria bacterium]|nr:hypothetical protein [Candidatus Parcubacteria bacterium]